MRHLTDVRFLISLLAILVPAALMTYIWWIIPAHVDDLWYLDRPDHLVAVGMSRFQANLVELKWHFYHDNIRLANIFYLVTAGFVSRPVIACFLGICFAGALLLLVRLGKVSMWRPLAVCTLLLVYTYCLQWLMFPFSFDFALNYVPTLFMMSGTVYMFLKVATLNKRQRISLYALALITGLWHESGSVPLVAALIAYMSVRCKASRRELIVLAMVCLGTAICFCTPGPWARWQIVGAAARQEGNGLKITVMAVLLLVPAAVWIYIRDYRKYGRPTPDTAYICLCASALVGTLPLHYAVPGYDRAWFCPVLLSISGWLRLVSNLFGEHRLSRYWWLSVPMLAVCIYHYTCLAITATDVTREYKIAIRQYIESDKDMIFIDIPAPRRYQTLWRQKCLLDHQFFHTGYVQYLASMYWKKVDRDMIFVPTALADVDVHPGHKVKGNTPAYAKAGLLYMKYNDSTAALLEKRFWGCDIGLLELNPDTFRTLRGKKYLFLDYHILNTPEPKELYY
ncbi:MAG: DUF6056 family protein [Prevotella sp.]|nr:DUF6056 family protein [Prevotella sp.]MCM1074788.1 DUF6056 family protein [Ruminococcus sp.]